MDVPLWRGGSVIRQNPQIRPSTASSLDGKLAENSLDGNSLDGNSLGGKTADGTGAIFG
jgi:hypothetical protein